MKEKSSISDLTNNERSDVGRKWLFRFFKILVFGESTRDSKNFWTWYFYLKAKTSDKSFFSSHRFPKKKSESHTSSFGNFRVKTFKNTFLALVTLHKIHDIKSVIEFLWKWQKCEREVLKRDNTFLIMQFSYNGPFRITYT